MRSQERLRGFAKKSTIGVLEEDVYMNNGTAAALLIVCLSSIAAAAQDKATPKEVVAKVREAASTLSKTGDLEQFKQRHGPWVWKDTYIIVLDCNKKLEVAHPIKPELNGQPIWSIKDTKGKNVFPEDWCEATKKPNGAWTEYWWPKPGETEGSRKLTYGLAVKGTPYVVNAGIYDDKAAIAEVSKLSAK
jgi:cytochrome c